MNDLIKILLIEDNPGDALLIKEALKDSVYLNTVLFYAETFNEAIKFNKEEILLILVDLNLPDSDGIETVRNIRKFYPNTAIIVLTGLDNDEISLATLREGAQNYLNKGEITGKVLEKNIRFSLERHQIIQKLLAADKELLQQKFILEKGQEMAHVGSWVYSMIDETVELSNETYKIFGLNPVNFGKNVDEFFSMVHDEDKQLVKNTMDHCIEEKKLFELKHRIVTKQGNIKWVNSQSEIYYNDQGIPLQIIGTLQDITEKKLFELQLQKSEAFNRGTLNALNSHIAVIDKNGYIVAVNDSWNKFAIENGETELSRTGVGSNYFEVCEKSNLLFNNIAMDVLQGIKDVMDGKLEVFNFEYPYDTATLKRWFAARVLKFESEEPMVVLAHLDITERKQAEIERIQITNDLIKRNKDLEQFSYIVSHNLRSPVANIIGLTNVAVDTNLDLSMKNEIIESLSYSVSKLDDVINDLNIILSTKQKINEKKEVVLFSEIVNDVQKSIENLMIQENVTLHSDFSEINEFLSIKSYFNSIFYNLISNSIKYHQPNIPPIIHIFSKLYDNKIELHFKDNGMGIDLTKKGDQVFGLYKRFHLNIGGKGMGLFMIKTQIESIGGKINIESEVNNGTTFIIELDRYE